MVHKLILAIMFFGISAPLLHGTPAMDDKASAAQTVTGCLQKGTEAEGFYLIANDGRHWELYSNPDVSLADHVGHTVTLAGTVAHRSKAQEEKSQPNEKAETGTRPHADLQVSSVKHVSETCSK